MSDNGTNSTSAYDYSAYNNGLEGFGFDFAPCDSVNVRNFGKVFLPTLYSLVFIFGFIGNGLVVCVLVKHRNQTNLTDICLFNLALSDLLFVFTLPLYAQYSVVNQWDFGDFICRFAAGSHNTGYFCSIFFMVVMTLDRYMVIMHAHAVARYRTMRAGICLTLFVWMLSFSVSLPVLIFTKVTNESQVLHCYYNPESVAWEIYNLFAKTILGLLIPFLVMVVCYSRIIPTLVNMRSTKKHRVVKLILSVVVVFFLFWVPYNISLLLKFLIFHGKLQGDECLLEANIGLAVTLSETFAYIHCCLNPIIYAFVGQKFMTRALQLLMKWMPRIPLPLPSIRDLSDSSNRKSSVMSRSSVVTSTFIS